MADADDSKVVIEGYIDKLGGKFKNEWQPRFVVVEGTSLSYFKEYKYGPDNKRAKSQGVLSLVGAVFEEMPENDGAFPFTLKLLHGKKESYAFRCQKLEDRTRWLTALRSKETGAAPAAAGSSDNTAQMYSDSIKEGELFKYEQKTGWQKIYCVLLPEVFLAYTDREAAQPKRLPLTGCSIALSPGAIPENKPFAFLLKKELKDSKALNFFLAAKNNQDMGAWMKAILVALDGGTAVSLATPKKVLTAAEAAEADVKKEADERTRINQKKLAEQNERKAAVEKHKKEVAAKQAQDAKKGRKGGLLNVLVSALEDENTKTAGIDGAARKRLASALKKQKQKIDTDEEKKKKNPRRQRSRSSLSVRRSFCDQQEGFYGSWQIKSSDDLNEYWAYLGVPLPIRLILLNDPTERVTFEGDGEMLTVKTRCALFSEIVGHDPKLVKAATAAAAASSASGAGALAGGGSSTLVGANTHMVPHRWYDLVTFRGSICLKQMFWADSEESETPQNADHLVLTFNTRLENKIGLVTEDFRLADDGDTMYHRMVLRTAEKEPRTITWRRQWVRLLGD